MNNSKKSAVNQSCEAMRRSSKQSETHGNLPPPRGGDNLFANICEDCLKSYIEKRLPSHWKTPPLGALDTRVLNALSSRGTTAHLCVCAIAAGGYSVITPFKSSSASAIRFGHAAHATCTRTHFTTWHRCESGANDLNLLCAAPLIKCALWCMRRSTRFVLDHDQN